MKLDSDPTVPKIVIIALLLFIEAFCFPAYAILQTNEMPTLIQWVTFAFGAVLQLVTFLITFLKLEQKNDTSE